MSEGLEDPKLSAEGELALVRLARGRLLVGLAGGLADRVPEPARPARVPSWMRARHTVRTYGQDGPLLGAASAVARRLGAIAEAVARSEQAVAVAPSMMTEIWLGYAYRAAGRAHDAIGALRPAPGHDPMKLSLYAD